MSPIALLTDFGTRDSYVGVMKGVIANIAPGMPVIDITHEIRAQDVAHAAHTLVVSVPYFPAGTVFCCVVDPGVGSARRAVAVEAGEWTFVLPDNGILTRVMEQWPPKRAVTLSNPRYQLPQPSATFHGRDIFAPAAAHLASGVDMGELGEIVSAANLHRLALPRIHQEQGRVAGSVMHIDHFGNLVTTITQAHLRGRSDWRISVAGTGIVLRQVSTTFADVDRGAPVAYIGSDGFLELAVRDGDAASQWQVQPGAVVKAESQNREEE
jgi:S-adenosyl-L-methionine hydrolase (adenosine-forming)